MSKAAAAEPRKGPPPPSEMAEGYEAMAMDLLANAQAEADVGEAMFVHDRDSLDANMKLAKAKRLREEAAVSAQTAVSLRLRILDEPKTELAIADEPEHPHQPGDSK